MVQCCIETPFGPMVAEAVDSALTALYFGHCQQKDEHPVLKYTVDWLGAYAEGRVMTPPPLAPAGTAFQQRVWQALRVIPYGETVTYGQLARSLGCPQGARAVGQACGSNPIMILIPCHRVVGVQGLGGYAGGLSVKRALLAHEKEKRC